MKKGFVNQDRECRSESRSWGPISGIRELVAGPTNSDVHLYADTVTLDTDWPIL